MKRLAAILLSLTLAVTGHEEAVAQLRAPAYPLVTIDPYTSAWSAADHLYDRPVTHWTGAEFPLKGILCVDGVAWRFMGTGEEEPALQLSAEVLAMNTRYRFLCGPVALDLCFTAPLFLDDYDLLSRPVNYISFSFAPTDGKKHHVSLRVEASPLWAANTPEEETVSECFEKGALIYLKAGTKAQRILEDCGDGIRINWGYFYLSGDRKTHSAKVLHDGMMQINREWGACYRGDDHLLIGYDDLYSIRFFGQPLRPWWNRKGDKTIFDAFDGAARQYRTLMRRSNAFDQKQKQEAEAVGGRQYAELCALAYRQAIHAHKLVQGPSGELFLFSKENQSNGSIGTVDVSYPSIPLFLYYHPQLAKGLLNFIFYETVHGYWTHPFPPHDIGIYPHAEGNNYSIGMPVEESGNMLLMTAAICHFSKDWSYAREHWPLLTQWKDYLLQYGADPEEQLCTDDFAGHLAHNANLAIKAILAIGAYGKMAEQLGIPSGELEHARELARKWMVLADDGDHYRLAYNQPGSWSLKYNLVWDSLLDLDVFPKEVARKEVAWYLTRMNLYGVPLDSRRGYTKTDWMLWTATLTENRTDFDAFIDPIWRFENETEGNERFGRTPMGDWIWTDTPKHIAMIARSVVGGYFLPLLKQKSHD